MFDIVGIDMPCMDLNLNTDRFPTPNGGARVDRLSWQGGGKVASGMTAAARLGARGAMLGAVGDDLFGRFCVEDFNRHGIDTAAFKMRSGDSTSLSVVLSDKETGGRSFVFKTGSVERYCLEDIDISYLQNTKYLFICALDDITLSAIRTARAAGAKIAVDADQYNPRMMAHIAEMDIFIASEFVYDALFQDTAYEKNARSLLAQGPSTVIFTLGDKGCIGVSGEGFFQWPGHPVAVADTVGAGDVFHGAYLASVLEGCTPSEAARRANAAAAIKCTRIGGRAGVPNKATLLKYLETGEIDYTDIDKRVAFYADLAVNA